MFEINPLKPNRVSHYSKTCVKRPLSKGPKIGFQDQLSLNAGQKYCRMLQGEHSAILSTFIKLSFVIKIFALSIFEWSFYTGFTVLSIGPVHFLFKGCWWYFSFLFKFEQNIREGPDQTPRWSTLFAFMYVPRIGS